MAFTKETFERMREDRARWLDEIASMEAGNGPMVRETEDGRLIADTRDYLAHLKHNVAEIERLLTENGEPFGCPSSEHLAQLAAQISGVQASSGG